MQSFPLPPHKLTSFRLMEETLLKNESLFNSFPIHSVHVLIPGSKDFLEGCKEIFLSEENTYFIVKGIPVSSLIDPNFVEQFVKTGSLSIVSQNTKAQFDNFVSIVPPGKLILLLENEISKSLSLIKENVHGQKRKKENHNTFIIDMNSADFTPGKKHYESVLNELNKINYIKFDVLLSWKSGGKICCQSIRRYWEHHNYECIPCEPHHTHRSNFSIEVPKCNFKVFDPSTAEDMLEWVGAQICGVKYFKESDNFISKFLVPEPYDIIKRVNILSFEGFFLGHQIPILLKEIRKLFASDSNLPFIALSISGYQDCYVVCNGFEKFSSADKLICVLLSPQDDCWVISLNVR